MSQQGKKQFAAVTGASAGIGYELAKQFAKHGFDLLIVAEDEGIFEVVSELEKLGAKAKAVQIDLASREGAEAFHHKIKEWGHPLDAIAINAGVGAGGAFVEGDLDELENLINLNVLSTMVLAQLVSKDMARRGQGRILFTSSVAAAMPGAFHAVYNASKAFVQSLSEAIRVELADSGVTVTALQPDATETDFFKRAHLEDTEVGVAEKMHPEEVAKMGFDALMEGKDHVIAGTFMDRARIIVGKVLPETVKAEQHAKMAKPGSAHEKH